MFAWNIGTLQRSKLSDNINIFFRQKGHSAYLKRMCCDCQNANTELASHEIEILFTLG